LINLRKINH